MDGRQHVVWDLYYRNARFIVYHGRFEIVATIFLFAIALLLAAAVLASRHNWPTVVRLLVGYITFATSLVGSLKLRGDWRAAESPPSVSHFIVAGVLAGCTLALIPGRAGTISMLMIVAVAMSFGLLHWLSLWILWQGLNRMKENFLRRGSS